MLTLLYFITQDICLTVNGVKSAQLLHGQFSNSITDLKPGDGNYNLLLTHKGKILADLYILNRGDDFLLTIPSDHATLIEEHLKKFAPLSRCTVENHQDKYQVMHIISESPPDIFHSYPHKRLGLTGYDIVFEKNQTPKLENFLKEKNAAQMTQGQIEVLRIKNGICRVGVDATRDNLPQESRLDDALHFNKGCYLGQETIARLHFRGHVNKVLCCFESSEKNISLNETILDGDAVIGKITSIAFDELEQKSYILGAIPLALKQSGKVFLTSLTKSKLILKEPLL